MNKPFSILTAMTATLTFINFLCLWALDTVLGTEFLVEEVITQETEQ